MAIDKFYTAVPSQADTEVFQVNPTIAAGDFQISTDDGAFANLATLPVVDPAGGRQIKIVLSAAERDGNVITIIGSDVAGDEWCDVFTQIFIEDEKTEGKALIFYTVAVSQADTDLFQVNPTIAAGDFKVSTDDGAFGNPATLPAVNPAGGKQIKIVLSVAEMGGKVITVIGSDAAGDEWTDVFIQFFTTPVATIPDSSFARMATVTASTKRSPGVTSGLEGAYVENIASLVCLPLDPVSPDLELGIEGLAWHEILQTAVDGSLDIVEGDILVVSGTEYPIRAVGDWDWRPTAKTFRVLYVEDRK